MELLFMFLAKINIIKLSTLALSDITPTITKMCCNFLLWELFSTVLAHLHLWIYILIFITFTIYFLYLYYWYFLRSIEVNHEIIWINKRRNPNPMRIPAKIFDFFYYISETLTHFGVSLFRVGIRPHFSSSKFGIFFWSYGWGKGIFSLELIYSLLLTKSILSFKLFHSRLLIELPSVFSFKHLLNCIGLNT